ncbi:MAG: hypothetical protein RQ754_12520 [Desulfuromonadales bacterium]|nr:hypothetical protein [Desulfuromonadales bacterium]
MSEIDVQRAMDLLKKAHELLKNSEVENLRKSADYLKQSIHWLNLQRHIKHDRPG